MAQKLQVDATLQHMLQHAAARASHASRSGTLTHCKVALDAWLDSAGCRDPASHRRHARLAAQQELGLRPQRRIRADRRDPADSGTDALHLRVAVKNSKSRR